MRWKMFADEDCWVAFSEGVYCWRRRETAETGSSTCHQIEPPILPCSVLVSALIHLQKKKSQFMTFFADIQTITD